MRKKQDGLTQLVLGLLLIELAMESGLNVLKVDDQIVVAIAAALLVA